MKLIIRPTAQVVTIDGGKELQGARVPGELVQIWTGQSEDGVPVVCGVALMSAFDAALIHAHTDTFKNPDRLLTVTIEPTQHIGAWAKGPHYRTWRTYTGEPVRVAFVRTEGPHTEAFDRELQAIVAPGCADLLPQTSEGGAA